MIDADAMDGTYLFVPPEESEQVRSLGAQWDDGAKCWYLETGESPVRFSRWLTAEEDANQFNISSTEAYVAATSVPCQACGVVIEVICIYCNSGMVSGETSIAAFTVSDSWAFDDGLIRQLRPWPDFHLVEETQGSGGEFANHCPYCGAPQMDRDLHDDPEGPFFDIPRAQAGVIRLTALRGRVQIGGNDHFMLE